MVTRQSFGFGGAWFGFGGATRLDSAPDEMDVRLSDRLPTVLEEALEDADEREAPWSACVSPMSVSRASTAASLEDVTLDDGTPEEATAEERDPQGGAPEEGATHLRRTGPGMLLHAPLPRRDSTLAKDLASQCAHVEARWGRVQAIEDSQKPLCLELLRRQKALRRGTPVEVLRPGEHVEVVD